ncbi:major tail protein [Halobacillus aidingensis]|uniref:Phage major tail protein, phi13 family n=1 Tax=Halobacillus aidingensis TaxID=240303 RepID=A0A1H0MGG5_HALAD|nr:major tail protein [Halobacillus aidingensis]SDO79230.1 phage major tail protein, phi13 family [Halobacillus aidingensis]
MALKGLKDLHYAVIQTESDESTTYDTPKPLGPAIAFNLQPAVNRANLRADDKVLFSDSNKGPTAVTLNTAYLEKEVEADLLGKTVNSNGTISDNASDKAPYVAVGGRAENARGGYDYFWIYRIQFAPAEENMNTKEETPTYQTRNLAGEAIPRLDDGEEKIRAWSEDESITDTAIFDEWFDSVINKDWVAQV